MLPIDFAPQHRKLARPVAMLVLATVFSACIVWVLHARGEDRLAALQQALATAQRSERIAARPVRGITVDQANAVNEAIRRLNTPWERMFLALNAASAGVRPGSVGLLSLEPDSSGQLIKVTAEARSLVSMLSYQRAMQHQKGVQSAFLVRHETMIEDPSAPVRFLIEARLSSGPEVGQ